MCSVNHFFFFIELVANPDLTPEKSILAFGSLSPGATCCWITDFSAFCKDCCPWLTGGWGPPFCGASWLLLTIGGWMKGSCVGCWSCKDGWDGRGAGCMGKEYLYCREIWKEHQEAMAHWTMVSRISTAIYKQYIQYTSKRAWEAFYWEESLGDLSWRGVYIGSTNLLKVNVIWGGLVHGCLPCFLWDFHCSWRWEAMRTSW